MFINDISNNSHINGKLSASPFYMAVDGSILESNENTKWSSFTFTTKWVQVFPKQEIILSEYHNFHAIMVALINPQLSCHNDSIDKPNLIIFYRT